MSKYIKNVSERMKSRLEDWKRLEQMKVEESEWKKVGQKVDLGFPVKMFWKIICFFFFFE